MNAYDPIENTSIHRHGDSVVMNIDSVDHSVHITPEFARKLAAKLIEYADDCETKKFTESRLKCEYVVPLKKD